MGLEMQGEGGVLALHARSFDCVCAHALCCLLYVVCCVLCVVACVVCAVQVDGYKRSLTHMVGSPAFMATELINATATHAQWSVPQQQQQQQSAAHKALLIGSAAISTARWW